MSEKLESKIKSLISCLYRDDVRGLKHAVQAAVYTRIILLNETDKKWALRTDDFDLILVTAAYLHDIGYINLIPKNYTLEEKRKAKTEHMIRGAKIAYDLTGGLGYSLSHRHMISFLIEKHDKLDEIYTPLQQILMEGDSLSMLDYDNVPQTLTKKELGIFLNKFKSRRGSMFETHKGIEFKDELLYPRAIQFYEGM